MSQITFDYKPLAIHRPFHVATTFERLLIGGYGSGKSYALCAQAISDLLAQPGSEAVIMRRTVPSLRDTTEAIFVSLLPDPFLKQCQVRRAGGHYESIVFPNGSKVMFRSIPTAADWLKLKSLSVAFLYYDELDEFVREAYEGMLSRVRQTEPSKAARALGARRIDRRGVYAAANPAGKNWVWQRFINVGGSDHAEDSSFFISTTLDNPHLPISYVNTLLSMPEPWVRRYVLCSFDDFGGAIYPEWTWDTHVIPPFRAGSGSGYVYPEDGFFIQGFDPGTHSGNAALWCYYDRAKHRVVAVAEYNETGLAVVKHTAEWRRIEARHRMRVRRRVADPKAITVRDRGSNVKLSDQYRRQGFHFQLGANGVNDRLTALGLLIYQGRFVVTSECMQTFEQIKNYRWEDLTPAQVDKGREAKPVKKDVDLVDAAQYIAGFHIAPPTIEADRTDEEQTQHEIRQAIRKQLAARAGRIATSPHDLGNVSV